MGGDGSTPIRGLSAAPPPFFRFSSLSLCAQPSFQPNPVWSEFIAHLVGTTPPSPQSSAPNCTMVLLWALAAPSARWRNEWTTHDPRVPVPGCYPSSPLEGAFSRRVLWRPQRSHGSPVPAGPSPWHLFCFQPLSPLSPLAPLISHLSSVPLSIRSPLPSTFSGSFEDTCFFLKLQRLCTQGKAQRTLPLQAERRLPRPWPSGAGWGVSPSCLSESLLEQRIPGSSYHERNH